jgi:hypothetical protein
MLDCGATVKNYFQKRKARKGENPRTGAHFSFSFNPVGFCEQANRNLARQAPRLLTLFPT